MLAFSFLLFPSARLLSQLPLLSASFCRDKPSTLKGLHSEIYILKMAGNRAHTLTYYVYMLNFFAVNRVNALMYFVQSVWLALRGGPTHVHGTRGKSMVNHARPKQNLLHYSSILVSHKHAVTPAFV